jgi:hypothetical protein
MQSHEFALKVGTVLSFVGVGVNGGFLAESATECHLEIGSRSIERLYRADCPIVPVDGRKRIELILCQDGELIRRIACGVTRIPFSDFCSGK